MPLHSLCMSSYEIRVLRAQRLSFFFQLRTLTESSMPLVAYGETRNASPQTSRPGSPSRPGRATYSTVRTHPNRVGHPRLSLLPLSDTHLVRQSSAGAWNTRSTMTPIPHRRCHLQGVEEPVRPNKDDASGHISWDKSDAVGINRALVSLSFLKYKHTKKCVPGSHFPVRSRTSNHIGKLRQSANLKKQTTTPKHTHSEKTTPSCEKGHKSPPPPPPPPRARQYFWWTLAGTPRSARLSIVSKTLL